MKQKLSPSHPLLSEELVSGEQPEFLQNMRKGTAHLTLERQFSQKSSLN